MARPLVLFLISTFFALNVFAATELEPKVLGPTGGNVSDTATAFAGGRFLTVWRQQQMPDVAIWGALSDADGNPLGPAFSVVPGVNALNLRLFGEAEGFVLFWSDGWQRTMMCRIDANGRASSATVIDPRRYDRVDAFVDGRAIAVSTGAPTTETLIFGPDGALLRSGIMPTGAYSFNRAFPGSHSFYVARPYPDLTIARFSPDGDALRSFTLTPGVTQCTGASACWTVAGLQESSNGSILLLLQSGSQLQTMVVAADGTQSARHVVSSSFKTVVSATLRKRGTQTWLVVTGGPKYDGPRDVEAILLAADGTEAADPVTIIRGLDIYETVMFTETPDALFVATSPGTAQRQIQTFLFRDLSPVTGRIVSITPTIQQNAQVASNGANFLAAWRDTDGVGWPEMHWAVLNAEGARVSNVIAGSGDAVPHSLVSNGLDYLMLLNQGGPLVARRLAADGAILGETTIATTTMSVVNGNDSTSWYGGVAVAAAGVSYLIAWTSGNVVYAAAMTASGSMTVPQEILRVHDAPQGWVRSYVRPALAWNGSEALLVIDRVDTLLTVIPEIPQRAVSRLEAYRIRRDASLVTATPVVLANADDDRFRTSVMASDGRDFLVVLNDRRFVVSPDSVTTVSTQAVSPSDLIWNGTSYLLARDQGIVERIGKDGVSSGAVSRRSVVGGDVAADSAGRLVMVASQTESTGPLRAYAYVAGDLTPLQQGRRRTVAP